MVFHTHRMFSAVLLAFMIMAIRADFVHANNIPEAITKGMNAYKESGADAAIQGWLAGSPMEGDKDALSQANILRQIEGFYGKYTGFESIKEVEITPSSRLQYIQINYEKGPLFTYFLTYKTGETWVVINFKFHTEPDSIFPSEVVFDK
ncbi:MAG: hypothetical protein AB7S78_01010 [Candidatus Omnitrophota bacterium]